MEERIKKNVYSLAQSGKHKEVVRFLEKELKKDPKNQGVLFNLAFFCFTVAFLGEGDEKEKYENKAKKFYQKVLEINPESDFAYLARAKYEEEFGDIKKALGHYRKAYEIKQNSENALHLADSLLYQRKGETMEAINFFEISFKKAKNLDEKRAASYPLALAYQKNKDKEKASYWAKISLNYFEKIYGQKFKKTPHNKRILDLMQNLRDILIIKTPLIK